MSVVLFECLGCGRPVVTSPTAMCQRCRDFLDREREEEEPRTAFPRYVSFPALLLNFTYRPRH